ncbi:Uncharacterised protein [uncultured archaeon]|nr:Uncharacterised protein [uncultured archaeon]
MKISRATTILRSKRVPYVGRLLAADHWNLHTQEGLKIRMIPKIKEQLMLNMKRQPEGSKKLFLVSDYFYAWQARLRNAELANKNNKQALKQIRKLKKMVYGEYVSLLRKERDRQDEIEANKKIN